MRALFELRRAAAAALGALSVLACGQAADAQLYWDINGTNPGATDTASASGTWSATDSFWTTDSTGASGQAAFVSGSAVVFSAGNNATGTSTITLSGTQTTAGLTVEEGTVALTGGGIVQNGTGPVRVNQGAVLSVASPNTVSTSPGSVLTLDGGTLRNTGLGGTFWDLDSTWELTSNGGTIDTTTAGANSRIGNAINLQSGTSSATLTKTGAGEFRATSGNFTTLLVNQGFYRIDQTGGTETGFGAVNGTVNVASGAAVGTSGDITSPATRSFSLDGGMSGATFVTNAPWTISGPISGDGAFVLNGNGFPMLSGTALQTLTLAGTNTYAGPTKLNLGTLAVSGGNAIPDGSAVTIVPFITSTVALLVNASETIGSLAGGNSLSGVTNVASGTLTTGGDNSSTTFAGQLTGAGNLVKTGTGTMTLSGVNTLGGTTTVNAGTLAAASVGSLSGYNAPAKVFANSGGTLAVKAGGASEWTSADIDTLRANATFADGSKLGIDTTTASFSYGSVIAGALGVTKIGGNTLTLSGVNSYTGGTSVAGGTLVAANADALAGGALDVSDGAVAQLQASLPKAVAITAPATHSSGTLDLTNNSVVLRGMSVDQVRLLAKSGFAGGAWNGTGLTSSTAAGISTTAIGFASNSILVKTSFKGVSPLNADDVLVKYTYFGDADLSGAVTLDDFTLFLNGYQNGGTTWVVGDFDYSGQTTLDDFTLFLTGYQQQGAPLSALASAVESMPMDLASRAIILAKIQSLPEPASGLMLILLAGNILGTRARRPR
jgi:autotransporter-associated beta strand protein